MTQRCFNIEPSKMGTPIWVTNAENAMHQGAKITVGGKHMRW